MLPQTTRLTHEGQITIPEDIRRALDMHEGEELLVEQVDGRIVLRPAIDTVRDTAGSLKQYRRATPVTPEEEDEAIERAIVEDYLASLRDE